MNANKYRYMGLCMLIGVSFFAFLCVKYSKLEVVSSVGLSNVQSKTSENITDNTTDQSIPIVFMQDENGNLTDISPSVLGSSTSCSTPKNTYSADSACTLTNNNVSVDGTNWVSSTAEIKLESVSVPYRLLSGTYSIKDSNKDISLDYAYYPSAGNVTTWKDVSLITPPGELYDDAKKKVVYDTVKDEAYSTQYTVSTDGSDGSGAITIDQAASNDCGTKCDAEENSNPSAGNVASNIKNSSLYKYPGEGEESEETKKLVIAGTCKNSDNFSLETKTATGCLDVLEWLRGTIGSLFPSSDWTQCSANKEGCVKAEDIAVKISPMFNNTNDYTTTQAKLGMDPKSASSYQQVYVITKCIASVGGKNVDVKCVWDMSYLFDKRQIAEFDDVGGSNTPTVAQYKAYLEDQSLNRTDPLYQM